MSPTDACHVMAAAMIPSGRLTPVGWCQSAGSWEHAVFDLAAAATPAIRLFQDHHSRHHNRRPFAAGWG